MAPIEMHRTHLFLFLCLASLLLFTSACQSVTIPTQSSQQTIIEQPGKTSAVLATGKLEEYALPKAQSGVMRPVMDSKGRIWFGEMGHNSLTSFDPRTKTFTQMEPPRGKAGIMGTVVAPDDTIWFAEQSANYIGQYNPTTKKYQLFDLPMLATPDPLDSKKTLDLPSAPNGITLDTQGNVWFTEMNADMIGKLDSKTKKITHYPLSAKKTVQTYNPYGITVDAQGIVWFTQASNNELGRLDPQTGKIRLFTLPGPRNPLMEITTDDKGMIWATTFMHATLLTFDPQSEQFTTYQAPDTGEGSGGGMYGITLTPQKELWVTIPSANVIARFDQKETRFVYYKLETARSSPMGIVGGSDGSVWYTAALANELGKLVP